VIQGKKLSGERIANLEKMSECPALPFSSSWVTVAGLPAIAGVPGVARVSAVPFKLAVAGGRSAIGGFPAVNGVLAVASFPADPGVPRPYFSWWLYILSPYL
jgi:hypothetical protein